MHPQFTIIKRNLNKNSIFFSELPVYFDRVEENELDRAFHAALKEEIVKGGRGTKARIARDTGLTPTYITRLVNEGEHGSEATRRRIAKVFGYTYEEFLNFGYRLLNLGPEPRLEGETKQEVTDPINAHLEKLVESLKRIETVALPLEGKRELKHLLSLAERILKSKNTIVREALKSNIVAFAEGLDRQVEQRDAADEIIQIKKRLAELEKEQAKNEK